jgi:trehalose 6-phosphate synthase
MGLRTDFERQAVISPDGHETWVRPYPLAIDSDGFERIAASDGVRSFEPEILRRRREHLILRVDRADLSKNVLRGFTAFDIFLEQHPAFRENVTFIAHLQPSRQDVPEYIEYLEKIEALVAVINHRHGTTDWMPIDLRLRDDFEEAVALYKHYDLLLVNAMWDGMNLVSKEGPLVNTRDGMIVLSENTGAHEELGDCALSVNPFDVQEQADAMYHALTATPEERQRRMEQLRRIITSRTPADWIDQQLADIDHKRAMVGNR